MKRYDLITPEGTKDLLFEDCAVRRSLEEKLSVIFKSRGYCEIVTPGLEFFDVFNLNSRYFPQESMYKLTDDKGRLLVVRPDSTMPIARVAATRLRDSELPLRLFYRQNVYRSNPVMRGRSDEIHQMGIELIGSNSRRADMEVLSAAVEALSAFESGGFSFEIGDIGFFRELVGMLDTDADSREEIRSLIEAKNYPALNDLLDSIGSNDITAALKRLPRLFGGAEVLDEAERLVDDEKVRSIIANLRDIYNSLSELGYNGRITIDLGIVNKLDYYTGLVMKGYLQGHGSAVLSGGRYDKLLAEFGYDVPATGFAVNIDAAAKVIKQLHTYSAPVPDVIVYGEKGYEKKTFDYEAEMRSGGYITENSVFDTYEETKAYAAKKGIGKAVCVGEEVIINFIAAGGEENGK